jgi:hypothetical protein
MADPSDTATKTVIPDWLRDGVAVVILGAFAIYLVVMILNIGATDPAWSRYMTILNVIQAFAAAAGGILLGTTIKTAQVKTAENEAQHAKKDLKSLSQLVQTSFDASRESPGKWFNPTLPVRPRQEGDQRTYIADVSAPTPTHWVVSKDEAEEVDPQFKALVAYAKTVTADT